MLKTIIILLLLGLLTDPVISFGTHSPNWAGYTATHLGYLTAVSGCWYVQTALSSPQPRKSSQWIGIGGWQLSSPELIQIGTDSDYFVSSNPAWYEKLPNGPQGLFTVSSGDEICASIKMQSFNPSTNETKWNMTITDVKSGAKAIDVPNGQGITTNKTYTNSIEQNSVDWIDERQSQSASPPQRI